jgi:membrane-associated phospholipid phosphatase
MERLARCIFWIGHPLVLVTVAVAIVVTTKLPLHAALEILGVLCLSTIAPVGLLLFLGLRSGRWRDADVSIRTERRRFYPIAIPLSAAGTLITWLNGAPRYILRADVITLFALVIAAITNLWFKISLHAIFAGYCAVVLFQINRICGWVALVVALLVVWSRVFLKRHTLWETVAGTVLGAAAGAVAISAHV